MATVEELRRQAQNKKLRDQAVAKKSGGNGSGIGGKIAKYYGDASRAMLQGATSGFGDEAIAYARSKLGGPDYETALGEERQRLEKMSPWIRYPGEISGGLGIGAVAAPLGAGGKVAQVASKAPGWLKAMGLGAVYGGAYGYGTGEGGAENRLESAALGAGAGAVTAGVLSPIVSMTRKGASMAAQQIRERVSPTRAAERKVAEALRRDNMTPGKLRIRLRELGPQATLADAGGKNVRSLATAVAGRPGPAQNRAEQILNQRAAGEGERIVRALNRGVQSDDFYAAEDAFLKNLREQAAPLYRQAYEKNRSIMTPALKRIIRGGTGRAALKEAATLFEIERSAGQSKYLGAVDKELTDALRSAVDVGKVQGLGRIQPGVIKGFSLETWDLIKRGLDSLLDSPRYRNELTGRLNAKGNAVYQLKRTLLKELDKATGGEKSIYAKARKIYSGDAEVLDALREGRKALNKDPELILRELGLMSDAGKEAYKSGAARALKDVVDKTGDTANAARKLFGNARARTRLRALFPGEDYARLAKTLIAEQQFAQTKNQALAGSQTREKLEAGNDLLSKVAGVAALKAGGGGDIAVATIRKKAIESLLGPNTEKYTAELGKMLFSRNPAMNQHAIDQIFKNAGLGNLPPQAKKALADQLLPLLIGQQTGREGARSIQSGQ